MDSFTTLPFETIAEKARGRLGIDVGSRSTKVAALVEGSPALAMEDTSHLVFSGFGPFPHITEIVSTGYGRGKVPGAVKIPEIRAHAVGALAVLDIDTFTLLDIGGQDFKVVRVEKGGIRDFSMNDKCAAGTGRFLEKMSTMLEMSLQDIGSIRGERKVLESTCSVFTETEIISLMMEGSTKLELASGVVYSVFERIRPYLRSYPNDTIVLTGGVASMGGLAETIQDHLNADVIVPEHAQHMGAVGCFLARVKGRASGTVSDDRTD